MWVVDYVIAHELLHRRHANHSAAFWDELKAAYPLAEQARGFIQGVSFASGRPLEDDREDDATASAAGSDYRNESDGI